MEIRRLLEEDWDNDFSVRPENVYTHPCNRLVYLLGLPSQTEKYHAPQIHTENPKPKSTHTHTGH